MLNGRGRSVSQKVNESGLDNRVDARSEAALAQAPAKKMAFCKQLWWQNPFSKVFERVLTGGGYLMYAAIRQAKAKPGMADELARRIKRGAISIISSVPGFLGYYVVYAPDDTVTAISVFNTVEGADESNRRALAWIEKNLGPLLFESVTATSGPVIVHSLP